MNYVPNLSEPQRDLPHYGATVRNFGDGHVEVSVWKPNPVWMRAAFDRQCGIPPLPRVPSERRQLSDEEKHDMHVARASLRARQRVRWLVKAIGADHLLTLSYRQNMQDADRLRRDWQEFVRLVRKRYPHWRYVAVRERQSRGAWHIHAAVVGFQQVDFLRSCWYRVVGFVNDDFGDCLAMGNVDVQAQPRHKKLSMWKRDHLSNYMTKYLHKDFEQTLKSEKRYWSPRGIVIQKKRVWFGAASFKDAYVEAMELALSEGADYTTEWWSKDWGSLIVTGSPH